MNPKDHWCSMCYSPNVKHSGGVSHNGESITGRFCSRECFDKWVLWKSCFLKWVEK